MKKRQNLGKVLPMRYLRSNISIYFYIFLYQCSRVSCTSECYGLVTYRRMEGSSAQAVSINRPCAFSIGSLHQGIYNCTGAGTLDVVIEQPVLSSKHERLNRILRKDSCKLAPPHLQECWQLFIFLSVYFHFTDVWEKYPPITICCQNCAGLLHSGRHCSPLEDFSFILETKDENVILSSILDDKGVS